MMETKSAGPSWKQRFLMELTEYWINVAYLTVFFGLFTDYRRLILHQYSIVYLNYGISLIKALVLAKVILVIDALRLGRKLESKPLAYSTPYKSSVFSVGVMLFSLLENAARAILTGKGLPGVRADLAAKGKYEVAAECLVVFFAFIPFFAFKELERVLGRDKLRRLFFSEREPE
jgi:hypothetical protein